MKNKTFNNFLRFKDGQEIFYWGMKAPRQKGVLVIVHGLGEHSGRYLNFVEFLVKQGWTVYLYDQRGHGKTPGLRSYVENFEELVEDLYQFIHFVSEQEGGEKPFLLGHSFGGQVVINLLAKHPRVVPGVILSSPNIKLAMDVPWLKRFLGRWVSYIIPSFSIPNDIKPKWISHDPKVVHEYEKDRLVQNRITVRLGNEILENLNKVPELAEKIKIPIFLFHGSEDLVTCPKGTEEFFERMKHKDRQLKIYPGFFHETLNEKGKEEVYHDVANWLEERVA
jgi:alpha-beta hydrolase superfamily lysophospholipase